MNTHFYASQIRDLYVLMYLLGPLACNWAVDDKAKGELNTSKNAEGSSLCAKGAEQKKWDHDTNTNRGAIYFSTYAKMAPGHKKVIADEESKSFVLPDVFDRRWRQWSETRHGVYRGVTRLLHFDGASTCVSTSS